MSMLMQAMRELRPALRIRTIQGEPITVGERQLVPIARSVSFTVGHPGGRIAAGYVRHSPVAVLDTWRGHTRRIPIPNRSRRITLALLASGLLLVLSARYVQRRRDNRTRSIEP